MELKGSQVMSRKTGLASVYIRHEVNFHGSLRPSYDSAPMAKGELTYLQLRTLNRRIVKYVHDCEEKNKKACSF